MALPYKLFKSLTIDGTTFGLDPDLGNGSSVSVPVTSVNAWTPLTTPNITATEAGLYLVTLETDASAFSSTGGAVAESAIKLNGGNADYNILFTYGGNGLRFVNTWFGKVNANTNISGQASTSIAAKIGMILKTTKLISL